MTSMVDGSRYDELLFAVIQMPPKAVLDSSAFAELCRHPTLCRILGDLADRYGWRVRVDYPPRREVEAIIRVLLAQLLGSMPSCTTFGQMLLAIPRRLAAQVRRQLLGQNIEETSLDAPARTYRRWRRLAQQRTNAAVPPSDEVIAEVLKKSFFEVQAARNAWLIHRHKPLGFFDQIVKTGPGLAYRAIAHLGLR